MTRVEATPERMDKLRNTWQQLHDAMQTSGWNQRDIDQLADKIAVLNEAPCTRCRFFVLDERDNGSIGLACKRYLSPVSLIEATHPGEEVYCRKFEPKNIK